MSNWLAFAVKTNILNLFFIWRTSGIWTNQSLLYIVKLVHRHSLSPCFCLLVNSADLTLYHWSKNMKIKSTRSSVSQPQICQVQTPSTRSLVSAKCCWNTTEKHWVKVSQKPQRCSALKTKIQKPILNLLQAECVLKWAIGQSAKYVLTILPESATRQTQIQQSEEKYLMFLWQNRRLAAMINWFLE